LKGGAKFGVNKVDRPAYLPEEKSGSQVAGRMSPVSFQSVLYGQIQQDRVKLSAHAQKRMEQRNIYLKESDWFKIDNAVNQAQAKGVRDSLLLYNDLALVASITNRTIVTALDKETMVNHVFTNIDGAVIIK